MWLLHLFMAARLQVLSLCQSYCGKMLQYLILLQPIIILNSSSHTCVSILVSEYSAQMMSQPLSLFTHCMLYMALPQGSSSYPLSLKSSASHLCFGLLERIPQRLGQWKRGGLLQSKDIFLRGLFPHPVNTSIVRVLNPPTFLLFLPGLWSSALVLSIHPSFSISDKVYDTDAPALGRLEHLWSIPVQTLMSST